ncbi:MAG TPA: hypothetical protein VHC95_07110 [Opitutales bacterium]|nr:hypothetical protein [Opitutales bacterium]
MKLYGYYNQERLREKPTKTELGIFFAVMFLTVALFALLCFAGCSAPALPGQTASEVKLDRAQDAQLSHAAAAVQAAQTANQANPEGLPKTATAGELGVANANLPEPKPEDAREALARVNAALTGQLATAQAAWAKAEAQGNALQGKIDDLQKQVAAEKAAAAANEKKANDRLCIIAALIIGGGFSLGAGLSLAAGLYFALPKLEYGAAGLGLAGGLAFFAATQVGTTHFNLLATGIILAGLAAAAYTVWHSFAAGNTLTTKADGLDSAMSALKTFAAHAAADVEVGAKDLGHFLEKEFDWAETKVADGWDFIIGALKGLVKKPLPTAGLPANNAVPAATPAFPPTAR